MSSRPLGISKRPDTDSRIFPARYSSLASIGQFVRSEASQAGFDETAIYQVEMAVDEACSNIIEHAYGGEGKGEIDCTCKLDETGLVVVLKDTGAHFDPDKVTRPNVNSSLEERESHGLGLFFIREWMDQVHFEISPNGGNTLTLVKLRAGKKPGKK
jgi:serine/threonine-protein kinase RsbW